MRVSFVSFDFGEYSVRHANALSEAGVEVQLVLAKSAARKVTELLDSRIATVLFDRPRFRQPFKCRQLNRHIVQNIHEFKPDVVHFQGGHLWFNFALPKLRRHPIVITAHNPRHHVGDRSSRRTPQWVMDYGYRQADEIIVHGDNLKRQVDQELGINADSIHVVPHITMGNAPIERSIPEDPKMVLFFGRIWEYKGLEYLIRAEPLISARIPDVRIVIAGRGEDLDRYRRMMVNPERFLVHNDYISDEQRSSYFEQAAVVVLPYISATQSGVVPIAFNHAKPVVATQVGSLQEFVDHEQTGLLVPPRDEKTLAEAIIRLLQDPSLRHEMGQRGKRKLDDECSPSAIADHHIGVYRTAIAKRQRLTADSSHVERMAGVS